MALPRLSQLSAGRWILACGASFIQIYHDLHIVN
jgi:hypothetical protein